MDDEKKDVPVVEDESVLDKELETSLSAIKAGQAPEEIKTPQVKPGEEPKVETPEEPKKAEESSNPPAPEGDTKLEFKLPIPGGKTKFESDEVYEKRVELMGLIEKKKLAKTPEQKQILSDQIKETRKDMSLLKGPDNINNLNKVVDEPKKEEDPATIADRARLKELGGATTEDIQEIIRQERLAIETKNTLENFVSRHPELKDEDVREVFFDYVDTNYNWQDKTGKNLMTVLELARESMFKPSETIQERVLKGANVQEKVNAMQFPGGTGAKSDYSPEMRKSIDELKATGMSEDKAVELLSD